MTNKFIAFAVVQPQRRYKSNLSQTQQLLWHKGKSSGQLQVNHYYSNW